MDVNYEPVLKAPSSDERTNARLKSQPPVRRPDQLGMRLHRLLVLCGADARTLAGEQADERTVLDVGANGRLLHAELLRVHVRPVAHPKLERPQSQGARMATRAT